jgi:hypothetical protein
VKVDYDKASLGYSYPLGAKAVRELIREEVPEELRRHIVRVRFGCNQRTTQEARIVARGELLEIRINFCPHNGRTRILTDRPNWTSVVVALGGVLDVERGEVEWPSDAAQRYTIFLLFHEIAHVLYFQMHGSGTLSSFKSSPAEEKWCDSFALDSATRLLPLP